MVRNVQVTLPEISLPGEFAYSTEYPTKYQELAAFVWLHKEYLENGGGYEVQHFQSEDEVSASSLSAILDAILSEEGSSSIATLLDWLFPGDDESEGNSLLPTLPGVIDIAIPAIGGVQGIAVTLAKIGLTLAGKYLYRRVEEYLKRDTQDEGYKGLAMQAVDKLEQIQNALGSISGISESLDSLLSFRVLDPETEEVLETITIAELVKRISERNLLGDDVKIELTGENSTRLVIYPYHGFTGKA